MDVRTALAATSALIGLLASAAPSSAANTHTMDGKKRTTATYKATLTEALVPSTPPRSLLSVTPELKDCRPASCDLRDLRLVLPKGTSRGNFTATIVIPRQLVASVVLYNATGDVVAEDDTVSMVACCDFGTHYTFVVPYERLYTGRYTLAVMNRGGSGQFQGTIEWTAQPPDRKPVKPS